MDNPSYPLSIPIRRPYDVTIDLVYTAAPEKSRIWRPPMRGHARPDRCRLARATLASAFPSIQITLAFRRRRRVREGPGRGVSRLFLFDPDLRDPKSRRTSRRGPSEGRRGTCASLVTSKCTSSSFCTYRFPRRAGRTTREAKDEACGGAEPHRPFWVMFGIRRA